MVISPGKKNTLNKGVTKITSVVRETWPDMIHSKWLTANKRIPECFGYAGTIAGSMLLA